MKKILFSFISLGVLLTGCKDDVSDDTSCEKPFAFTSGILVVNEGPFGGTGSLSHVDLSSNEVTNFIYDDANCDVPAGHIIQSANYYNGKGYVVANASGEVHVVDLSTFKNNTTLSFSYPRYTAFNNGYGYVSNGNYEGKIYKFSAASNTVIDSVVVGDGPENLVVTNDYIISANSGGWGVDSSISFINSATFEVDSTLNLSYKPNDMVICENGNLWVSCKGLSSWDTNGPTAPKLFVINLASKSIINEYTVGTSDEEISKLAVNPEGDVIYYYKSDGIYAFNIDGSSVNDPALINGEFYGVDVDPTTGKIYACNAKGFTSDGEVSVFDAQGDSITSYSVGIGPNGILFH